VCLTSPQWRKQASPDQPAEPDDRRALDQDDRGELFPSSLAHEVCVPLPHDLLVGPVRREHDHRTVEVARFFPPRAGAPAARQLAV
jgi:hypothetical protein